jgi:aminoglycoside-2''-adenylyltransferase
LPYHPGPEVPAPVARAVSAMAGFERPWYLCGGWAVDAWLGRETRVHKDVDIAVFEADLPEFRAHFAGWRLVAHDTVEQDAMEPWDGRRLLLPAHIHTTRDGFELDVQINQRLGHQWVLNREPYLGLGLPRCAMRSAWDVQTLTPELVLFYKTFEARPHDEADLRALLPQLSTNRLAWLRDAIALVHPGHAWLDMLQP